MPTPWGKHRLLNLLASTQFTRSSILLILHCLLIDRLTSHFSLLTVPPQEFLSLGSRLYRALPSFLLLTLLALSFPQTVLARPAQAVTVNFDVIAVKRDESVTIRTKDFPLRTKFTARMDVVGKQALNGTLVGEFNSDKGGVFDQKFAIPDTLKGKVILALRIESTDGYLATNWFFNETSTKTLPDEKAKPEVNFSETKKNTTVTVEAKNLPANTSFWVRVGPFENFYSKYAFLDMVTSDASGAMKFPVTVPASAKDAEYIMVRLDGGGTYIFNVYKNVDGGTAVPLSQVYKVVECKLLSINPIPAQDPRGDFDVIWTVQNTGLKDWEMEHVIFKYIGGTKMHKYEDVQTLPSDIKRGQVYQFVLDMRAPTAPGWYTETWMVAQVANGNKNLCKLSVTIAVK